jgi:hypothetical protein
MVASENDHDDAARDNVAVERTRMSVLMKWTILFESTKETGLRLIATHVAKTRKSPESHLFNSCSWRLSSKSRGNRQHCELDIQHHEQY